MNKIVLLLLVSFSGFAQSWVFYKPTGEIAATEGTVDFNVRKIYGQDFLYHSYTPKNKSINRIENNEGIYSVIFQLYTKKPVLLLGGKTNNADIKSAIDEFDLNAYYKSWEFNYSLKKLIKENKLTIELIYKSFGQPKNTTSTSASTFLHYNTPNIVFMIKNGFVVEYTLMN
jgi:hypothetical protein